ncbi:farnesol dehydrogenase-like isoform X2 [Epargyreus clarus]|uniref:farnesol dehydrogenase-like isoform X2 n=1 Tax=Epargyreus clarus TaxID=520877 RepID=UPI003C2F1135
MEQGRDWVGKTAVVTGASAGIGAAICVRLARAGLRVVGLARRPELVDKLKSEVNGDITSRQCDVSNAAEVKATFKWIEDTFGGVDVLVNNAGVFHDGNITDLANKKISDDDFFATVDINVKGTFMCTRLALDSMTKRGFNGHIIHINSVAGHYIPAHTGFNVYPASKHAITAFTQSLLNELAHMKSKIKVTSISPGLVRTAMAGAHGAGRPALHAADVADTVLYVLSTPPHVNISELTVSAVMDARL